MQAVIMAGGKGTRLFSVTGDLIPKPMVKIDGKPLIEYQLEVLKQNGITEIYIVVGYLGDKITSYLGDGSKWGLSIRYINEESPLGTAGALFYLKEILKDDFLLVFGDILFDIDTERMMQFHKEKKALASLLVHPNSHPYDSDLVIMNRESKITGFISKHSERKTCYHNLVNAGIYCIRPDFLSTLQSPRKIDLEKDLIFQLIEEGEEIYGYYSPEYVKDIGTPERLETALCDLQKGIIKNKNLRQPQKCIFLDRDGTINRYVGLLSSANQLKLENHVIEALNMAHQNGYLVIVVTNQPVIARNLCSLEELNYIHSKLETLLGEEGAYVDSIKYCPHHPDKGYPEERKEYKIQCECRKPGISLISQSVKEYHIDLDRSCIIGDTTTDIKTGRNAGITSILVKTGEAGQDGKYQVSPDYTAPDLRDAVEWFIKRQEYEGDN